MSKEFSSVNAFGFGRTSFTNNLVMASFWNFVLYFTVALKTVEAKCSPVLAEAATLTSEIYTNFFLFKKKVNET